MTDPSTHLQDDDHDRELRDLVRRSVEHVHAPLPRLMLDAQTDGRALLRRRRVTTGLATAAAVGVAALLVPLAVGAGRGAAPDGDGSAATSPPSITATTDATPESEGAALVRIKVSGDSPLLGALRSSPPEGVVLVGPTHVDGSRRRGTWVERSRILHPGVASGQVRASSSTSTAAPACPGRLGSAAACSLLMDSTTGEVVGIVSSTSFGSVHVNEVAVSVPGRGQQTLGVANTDDDLWGPEAFATGDTAPLSTSQLVAVAARVLATPLRQ